MFVAAKKLIVNLNSPPALIDNGRHDKCMYIWGNSVIFMIVCLSQQHLITLKEMVALSETVTVLRNNAGKLAYSKCLALFAQEQRSHKKLFNLQYSIYH